MKLNFDKTFSSSTNALHLNRSHPFIKRDKKWFLHFTVVHGYYTVVYSLLVYNVIYYDLKINDFIQTCKNMTLCVVYNVVTFQYVILLWRQDYFIDLIRDMNKDYEQTENLSRFEKGLIYEHIKAGLWVCKQWKFIAIAASNVFIIKTFAQMMYYYFINEFQLVPLYDVVWYPPVLEENKNNIFVFLFTFSSMMCYLYYSAVMYAAYVPLGPIFILHACGQLEIAKNRIDDLCTETDDEVLRKKLVNIIEMLQYVHRFVDRINKIFKIAYELTLKATTILLPITCYTVLEAFDQGAISLEFITFIIGGTLISSSPCYYSDLLIEKSEKVRLALYTCGWERHHDRRMRKILQLTMQYAHNPIAVNTVFRPLCLDALTELFQQSYAIFNLMNAMWN